jgi:hypothetical protein
LTIAVEVLLQLPSANKHNVRRKNIFEYLHNLYTNTYIDLRIYKKPYITSFLLDVSSQKKALTGIIIKA